jgi:methionyl-tRNA formyltransferase
VTYAPRLGRADGRVDWAAQRGVDVDRLVRALQPWPGVLASLGGVDVQIQAGAPVDLAATAAPGTFVGNEGESMVIACREGGYRVDLITPPGKRAMSPAAFLRGRRSVEAKR